MAVAASIGGGIAFGATVAAQSEPAPAQEAVAVPSALAAHFAALASSEGSLSAGAGASRYAKRGLAPSARGLTAQFGLNPGLAREVTYGDAHVWIVPGGAGVCIEGEGSGGGCGSIAQALEGSVAVGTGGEGEGGVTVYGLVPDGNSQVVVHNADGSSEDVPVEHNVYVIKHSTAVSAEVIDGSGKLQTIELPK